MKLTQTGSRLDRQIYGLKSKAVDGMRCRRDHTIAGRHSHACGVSRLSSAKSGEPEKCEKVWSLLGSGLNYIALLGQGFGRRWNLSIYCEQRG